MPIGEQARERSTRCDRLGRSSWYDTIIRFGRTTVLEGKTRYCSPMSHSPPLHRFAYLSIGAAVLTIGLKAVAFALTGSVGLLSDALESTVNLVAAVLALIVLWVARLPPDEEHTYGHTKAEYLSSGAEGTLIVIAAGTIAWSAIDRLLHPQPLELLGIGLTLTAVAALVNYLVARTLIQAGRRHRSVTLEANARHLLTDVWTSAGVVTAVLVVQWTGLIWLDPVIALAVAAQIVFSGVRLIQGAIAGLMDAALPAEETARIEAILDRFRQEQGIDYHALRTRQSGAQRFVSVHVQVPGAWSVQRGHSLLEALEQELRRALAPISVFTHLEPVEDPRSWQDIALIREDPEEGIPPPSGARGDGPGSSQAAPTGKRQPDEAAAQGGHQS